MERNKCFKTLKGKLLTKVLNGAGYYHVALYKDSKRTTKNVHLFRNALSKI